MLYFLPVFVYFGNPLRLPRPMFGGTLSHSESATVKLEVRATARGLGGGTEAAVLAAMARWYGYVLVGR